LYGAEDKFALLETKGPHKDTPELRLGAYRWMNRWLMNDNGEDTEQERPKIDVKDLKVFKQIPPDAINNIVQETYIKPARPELLHVEVCDEARWDRLVDELGPDFHDAFQSLRPPDAAKAVPDRAASVLKRGKFVLAVVAPRGIGPTRWAEVGTPADNHIKRKFALIGQTLDGQRVWDVRRALAGLRSVPELKRLPRH